MRVPLLSQLDDVVGLLNERIDDLVHLLLEHLGALSGRLDEGFQNRDDFLLHIIDQFLPDRSSKGLQIYRLARASQSWISRSGEVSHLLSKGVYGCTTCCLCGFNLCYALFILGSRLTLDPSY
jgi:hypothetical protein